MRAPATKSSNSRTGIILLLSLVAVPIVGMFGASLYAGLHYGFTTTAIGMLAVSSVFIALALAKLTIDYVNKLRTTGPDKIPGFLSLMTVIGGVGLTAGFTFSFVVAGFSPASIALVTIMAAIGTVALAKMGLEYYLNKRASVVDTTAATPAAVGSRSPSPSDHQSLIASNGGEKFVRARSTSEAEVAPASGAGVDALIDTSGQAPGLS